VRSFRKVLACERGVSLEFSRLEPTELVKVIIGCGMISNNAPTIYAFSNNLQLLIPMLLKIPRFVFAVLATAM
jgi:hypothetical protein